MKNKLYILCGIPFSGKTTLAKRLAEKLGFTRIDLDEVKFELFNPNILDVEIDQSGWDRVYQEMYLRIKQVLENGETVVHDTGNFTKAERDLVKKIADQLNIETTTIFVDIPKEEALKRLLENRITKKRFDVDMADFESTTKEMEPPTEDEKHLVFKWTDDVDGWILSLIK
ncbi:MAG TPA: ATP-binding protein [Candidatus Woesebacteria bacterium]|nr:ATP-binding protein [Candidatus Woesebacteria bacterium]